MFVAYSVHYPESGKVEMWARQMREFDQLIKKQPGVIFVSDIFSDPARDALMGYTFWESEEDFRAAWPTLVKEVPTGGEVRPPELITYQSVP